MFPEITNMAKTMQQLAQSAIDVQDACNLSGVAHSFAELCYELRMNHGVVNTRDCNEHPLVRLYVSKLVSLSMPGCELRLPTETFSQDWVWAREQAKQAA